MKRQNDRQIFVLSGTGIDNCSEYLEKKLEDLRIERHNRIRIRLTIEEILLRYRKKFGDYCAFSVIVRKRFGVPNLQIELEEEMYNPMNKQESELEDWNESLLTNMGISPTFVYSGGKNILRFSLPYQRMNPVLRIFIAIAIGFIGGLILKLIIPEGSRGAFSELYLTPVGELWMSILSLISGPVIFFMVVSTVLGIGGLSGKGADGKWVIGRYFLITALIAAIIVTLIPNFIPVNIIFQQLDQETISALLYDIFNVVPNDFFSPFINADTPQLILIALLFGTILNILRDHVPNLIKISKQFNTVGMLLAEWSSWLVPIFTCVILMLEIENEQTKLLISLWKPVAFSVILVAITVAVALCYTAIRKHVSVITLIKKLYKPLLIAIRKGSLSDSYGQTEISCVRYLGMDKDFTEISLSHGLVLYMPANIIGALVMTISAISYYSVDVTLVYYITAVVLVIILMEAAPPVPGVSLLVYIVVFGMLGIPDEALIPAMVFDILFGILSTAVNQMMLQIEMIFQADRLGLIDRAKMRKPL